MIKSIRMRPLEKPFITQEILYNHRQEIIEDNSQASFLRISQNSSKELKDQRDPFTALENKIYTIQQRSALRLNQVKANMAKLEGKHTKVKAMVREKLIQENKENSGLTYKRMPLYDEKSQQFQHCNFEMDENYNYVKSKDLLENSDDLQNTVKVLVKSQQFYSLETSKVEQQTRRKQYGRSISLGGRISQKDHQKQVKEKSSSKLSRNSSVKTHRSQSNSEKIKKGRVYEEILSLYSIPKLLAMEPKAK